MNKYVAYYRVSTEEQGDSGLGLLSQRRYVSEYINKNGILVGEYTDIDSGKLESREGMNAAINKCIEEGAILVVKVLSRISRGGYKYRQILEENNIKFIEYSSPHDSEFIKDVKFSFAKEERNKISSRTIETLAEIKSKISNGTLHISKTGNIVTKLGNPKNLTDKSRSISLMRRKENSLNNENNKKAGMFIVTLKDSGKKFSEITTLLNKAGFKTRRNGNFSQVQTTRLYNKYKNQILVNG